MFASILEQINTLIKAGNDELRRELIKEIRSSEALIRADIACKRRKKAGTGRNGYCNKVRK